MSGMTNTPAEFNLLAGLIHNPELYFELAEFLSVDDFSQHGHKQLFIVLQRLIMDLNGKTLVVLQGDLLAKAAELNLRNFHSDCNDGELLTSCYQHKASSSDTVRAFNQVKRETVKRSLVGEMRSSAKYLQETEDPIDRMIAHVEDGLINANNKLQGATESPIIHLAPRALEIIEELSESPGQLGLDIGLPTWQRGIGGIRNGAVTFIAASTGQGKSQLGIRAAIEIAKLGLPVLVCDSELNELAQSVRVFGQFTGINYEILETGYWKANQQAILNDGYDQTFVNECQLAARNIRDENLRSQFKSLPIYYQSINGMSARDALPFLRRWVMQHVGIDNDGRVPRCLIVWDYVKLAHISEVKTAGVGAHDLIGADCAALHDFAEKYNLPIIAFGQTNRNIDENIDCIAGAKKIAELSDSVSLFKRKTPDEMQRDPSGTHIMKVFKARYGKGIQTHVNLQGDLSIGKFTDMGVSIPVTIQQQGDDDDGDED